MPRSGPATPPRRPRHYDGSVTSPSLATWPDSHAGRAAAAAALRDGGLVLLPTESSYAIAADARSDVAVGRVRALKGRADGAKPLLLLAASLEQVSSVARLEPPALRLAAAWPAALTLVLPPLDARLAARLGGTGLAIRIPAHAGTREVIERLAGPVTGTSANLAGEPPVLDAGEALRVFVPGAVAGMLDGGRLPGGAPSTLVGLADGPPRLLREGPVSREQVEELLGERLAG